MTYAEMTALVRTGYLGERYELTKRRGVTEVAFQRLRTDTHTYVRVATRLKTWSSSLHERKEKQPHDNTLLQ